MRTLIILITLSGAACVRRDYPGVIPPRPGAPNAPRCYVCPRTEHSLNIDGRLDETAWQAAPWTEPFVDIEGPSKPLPRLQTHAKMLWNDQFLYLAAQLDEPHVWAKLTARDAIVFNDNDFEVFIDPNGDERRYFEIELNAFGTVFDLLLERTYAKGGPAKHGWEAAGLMSAVLVDGSINDPSDTDRGWTLEIALPWAALGDFAGCPVPPEPGDTWRVNFSRVEWRQEVINGKYRRVPGTREENWVWSPTGEINMHIPRRWGFVTFASEVVPPRTTVPDQP
jgi:hypothetical protein